MKPEITIMNLMKNSIGSHAPSSGPKAKGAVESPTAKSEAFTSAEGEDAVGRGGERKERPAFGKVLKAVATANQKAATGVERAAARRKQSESEVEPMPTDVQAAGQVLVVDAGTVIERLSPEFSSMFDGTNLLEGAAQASDASSILRNAIETVSQTLKLNIGKGLENLDLGRPTQAAMELCVEVLSALKGIIGLLENAVATDQAIDVRGTKLDAAQAAAMEKTLLTEVFHIELALSMVEGGGTAARPVVQGSDQPAGSAVITAKDPSNAAMPVTHLQQLLSGEEVTKGQDRIEALLSRLAVAVRTQSGSGNPAAFTAPGETTSETTQEAAASLVPADGGKKTPELGDWDAKVMRMLLKIDKTESENTQAAIQNEKLDLPKVATALFAKKPGQMRSALADGLDAALQAAFGTKGPAGATGMVDPAKSMAMPKTVEESIMTQLSGRVTEAIKSGVNEIRLLLRPESLGEMRVKLTLDGEVVMGKIYVENQQVKHIVEANLQTLRDSLGQHGLQTGSFDVDVGGHAREHLDDSSGSVASRDARNNGEVSDGAEKMESDRSAVIGGETGRRFGSNTIEYFA